MAVAPESISEVCEVKIAATVIYYLQEVTTQDKWKDRPCRLFIEIFTASAAGILKSQTAVVKP